MYDIWFWGFYELVDVYYVNALDEALEGRM